MHRQPDRHIDLCDLHYCDPDLCDLYDLVVVAKELNLREHGFGITST